ncbi:amiloride-sensitive sodium channel subunit gamma-like [Stegodyphus dumicola]|uniref:amiloride-sensitive sodium channel subunit gamma-like n=1 Tax=Stegodyphus dumicola TaxID=202533 RepID=UPI0015A7A72E|nr:amiloride-sensitive sodium channel subunit gamma-like [Stegodyphus dumicola]
MAVTKVNSKWVFIEKNFNVYISASKLNKDFFRIVKKIKTLKLVNGTPHVAEPQFKMDMMGLLVFYKTLTITNMTETSIYSWEFLVANIGGNLGLFLGLSLITFVEIIEFIVDVLAKYLYSVYKKYRC